MIPPVKGSPGGRDREKLKGYHVPAVGRSSPPLRPLNGSAYGQDVPACSP
jgi:hypothetical protein